MIDDNLDDLFDLFTHKRTDQLFTRFPGIYRAVVVDTNDPLQMHRIRYKCPEWHDFDVKDEDCPWAMPAPWMGGNACGSWTSFMRDDRIFIILEKGHPYGPYYIAGGDASRRARYVLDSVYIESPPSLTEDADADETPDDYEEDWLPKDFRPMSTGMRDRYGNCFIMKAYGYFPKEHDIEPTPVGFDAVAKSEFEADGEKPKKNEPDAKYMAMYSKYGNFIILNDVGFDWKKDGGTGEFKGDWDEDKEFERKRAKYFTKAFTEQEYKDRDQRRIELRTRYGHLIEMRDVGWNKPAGQREKEYDDSKDIAKNKANDEEVDHRWIKLRTKGGHLFQMYDKGFDQKEDLFIKTHLEEEGNKRQFGEFMDQEGKKDDETFFGEGFWHERDDGRFTRLVTRYGYKFVLDDRGTDNKEAHDKEDPHGNGFLLKGRRKGRDDEERGFGMEFNEKAKLQHASMYSPKSKIFEINDKYDYIMACTDTGHADEKTGATYHMSENMTKRAENEFSTKIAMGNLDGKGEIDLENGSGGGFLPWDPEVQTHHLKLDQKNAYVRLKTYYKPGIPAGLESRCGSDGGGTGKNWTELVDHQDRGLWMTNEKKRTVLRSQTLGKDPSSEPEMWLTFDEEEEQVIVVNKGKLVQIYCKKDVQVIAGNNINMEATKDITIKAGQSIRLQAANEITNKAGAKHIIDGGGSQWVSGEGRHGSNVKINAPTINADNPGLAHVQAGSSTGDWPVGVSTPDGEEAPPVEKIKKKKLDAYKPDGIDTENYNKDRAEDDNEYEPVVRKTDIWGE